MSEPPHDSTPPECPAAPEPVRETQGSREGYPLELLEVILDS